MVGTWFSGFGTGMGLIVAIGAQNVFVLTQGIHGRYVLTVPFVCFLCDVLLMTLGVWGVGSAISADARLLIAAAGGGTLFLTGYGADKNHHFAFLAMFNGNRVFSRNPTLFAAKATAPADVPGNAGLDCLYCVEVLPLRWKIQGCSGTCGQSPAATPCKRRLGEISCSA